MVSLIVHAVLGVAVVGWLIRSNPTIFRRPASGPAFSGLEVVFLVVGVVSVALGWYFNVTFVLDYGPDQLFFNPLWGDGSWAQYLELMYDNPAAGSAGADFTVANVVLLPLITIVDGIGAGSPGPGCSSSPPCSRASRSAGRSTSSPSSGSAGWPPRLDHRSAMRTRPPTPTYAVPSGPMLTAA